jgi:hypothetical protein
VKKRKRRGQKEQKRLVEKTHSSFIKRQSQLVSDYLDYGYFNSAVA